MRISPSENFPVFYHSTSFILSACGCCMGKGRYRNTKYKYVIRRLGADVWFSLWFCVCVCVCFCFFFCVFFFFYGTLSKNGHAGPSCVAGLDKDKESGTFLYGALSRPMLRAWTMDGATWVIFGPREHQNIFREQGSIGLYFKKTRECT